MDEQTVRSLLDQIANSGAPPSSVDIGKARRAGLRRLVMRRIGAPAASLGAVAVVAGLVATGAVPLGHDSSSSQVPTVLVTSMETAELTNTPAVTRAAAKINNALEILIQRCMASKGFTYQPSFRSPDKPGYPGRGYPGLAGVPQATIGLAARKANGYGFQSSDSGSGNAKGTGIAGGTGTTTGTTANSGKPRKEFILALQGRSTDRVHFSMLDGVSGSISSGGCAGDAKRRLYGTVVNWYLTTSGHDELIAILLNAVTTDPAFTAVAGRWSSCMADHGYSYSNPEDLWNTLADQLDKKHTAAMRNLEIKVALADYRCAKTVALLPTVRSLQARHARYFPKAYAGALATMTRLDARALALTKALHLHRPAKR
ncbi:MAG: hypothetical protein LBV34_17260 [Nocardiopsaceae bacterium]|nr:hypothetical protein [Nocardiopsaceae bacterium]